MARSVRMAERLERIERTQTSAAITRRLFLSKYLAIVVSDLSGNILDASPGAEILLQRSLEQLRMCGWEGITHPSDIALDRAFANRCGSGELTGYVLRKRYLTPDGDPIPVEIHAMKINGGEVPTGIYVVTITKIPKPITEASIVEITPTERVANAS